jgi:predicted Zn-dependent protease
MAYTRKNATVGVVQKLQYSKKIRAEFERAVELDPEFVAPHFGLLQFHVRAPAIAGGNVSEARRQAEIIERLDPLAAHRARAILAENDGDLGAAEAELDAGLQRAPDDARLLQAAVGIARERDDCEAELDYADRLVGSHPADPWAWYHHGRALVRCRGDAARAESDLERFLQELPGSSRRHAEAWLDLGTARERSGRPAEASEAYRRALELDPDLGDARDAAARLESDRR